MHDYRNGIKSTRIFIRHGIDPEILGSHHVDEFPHRIKEQPKRPEGFSHKENSSKGNQRRDRRPIFKIKRRGADLLQRI